LLVELLAGVLSGMGTSNQNDYQPTEERPWNEGIFFMAVDIGKIMDLDLFKATIDGLVRSLSAIPPANGFDRVFVPGEMEGEKESRYQREGIPVREDDWSLLTGIAGKYGVAVS
jgi:LDH2 family malate/lactate/ureidoglycolate dehydrogenase